MAAVQLAGRGTDPRLEAGERVTAAERKAARLARRGQHGEDVEDPP
jgi:GTP-binding protein